MVAHHALVDDDVIEAVIAFPHSHVSPISAPNLTILQQVHDFARWIELHATMRCWWLRILINGYDRVVGVVLVHNKALSTRCGGSFVRDIKANEDKGRTLNR